MNRRGVTFLAMLLALPSAVVRAQGVGGPTSLGRVVPADGLRSPGTVLLLSPGDPALGFQTIQAAVDAASEGDTVLLSDGTFQGVGNRGVVVEGKNLVIRSQHGPELCVIDCEGAARGFLFRGAAVGKQTILRGVTIQHGHPSPADELGHGGGVLALDEASPRIEDCILRDNEATVGGGIAFRYGNIFGAPFPAPVVVDCVLLWNRASYGGGISASYVTIERCTLRGNQAQSGGGGIACSRSSLVRDTLVADNVVADGPGGGMLFAHPNLAGRAERCTVVNNRTHTPVTYVGGGIHVQLTATTFSECILWGNQANGVGDQFFSGTDQFPVGGFCFQPTLDHCLIEGGAASVAGQASSCEPILISILDQDPEFVDPMLGDYRLAPTSPCRDAGNPASSPALNEGDIENQPRANGLRDIGCDEVWPGLALALPSPGRAGERNEVRSSGSAPGEVIGFFYGHTAGALDFSFAGCPGLTLEIADGQFLTHRFADAAGEGSISFQLQPAASGSELFLQAIGFAPGSGCLVSNLVRFLYP